MNASLTIILLGMILIGFVSAEEMAQLSRESLGQTDERTPPPPPHKDPESSSTIISPANMSIGEGLEQPIPVEPISAQELGYSIPKAEEGSYQPPPIEEISSPLIPVDQSLLIPVDQSLLGESDYESTTNRLYIMTIPRTVAGCYLYGWLPMWLRTFNNSPVWLCEWYPSGRPMIDYLGYASSGWKKHWFMADTPGWHILQFYSKDWSNHIYIYVHTLSIEN